MLFTQRASEALDAGLSGYISRGLFLLIQDQTEALAACAMFNLDRTYERMGRITAKATLGSAANDVGTAPNWSSMRALRRHDPTTGEVLRGAVGIYADLAGRAVPACRSASARRVLEEVVNKPRGHPPPTRQTRRRGVRSMTTKEQDFSSCCSNVAPFICNTNVLPRPQGQ